MNPKRVGIYLRVSTHDGRQSCEMQKRELEEFIHARGWTLVGVYEDAATGTNANRPKLRELLQDARARRVDLICCWKLDRFFRSLKDLVTTLHELSDLGVEFVSLRDNIDLSTASGRLMLHLLGAFSEFEAALCRERVRAGIANARAKGKKLGRPITVDSNAILQLRQAGLSYRKIAKKLGVSHGSIADALSR